MRSRLTLIGPSVSSTTTSRPPTSKPAGGNDKLWVDFMYQDLLGRAADSQGESYWTAQLAAGANRSNVAYGFAASLERERQRVNDDYFHYLGRQADSAGVDYWLAAFAHGTTNEDVIAGFLASDEYFAAHSSTQP